MNRFRTPQSLLCLAAVALSALAGTACKADKVPMFNQGACGSQDAETARWCAPRTFAGGISADAHTLNDGHEAYMLYCYACHGENGDGKGPASYGYRPPPRNFTQGIFKFARVQTSDDLPNDEDLFRIVRGGLHGTPMLPWDITEGELRSIIQYIKTFAPKKWEKKKKNGEPVPVMEDWSPPQDPWKGKEVEAVQRGKELYHFKAECVNCHPGYGTKKELYDLSVVAAKREPDIFKAMGGFRDDLYGSVAKDSAEYGVRILPPDFTFNQVRSVRDGEDAVKELFRVISFGVYPIMPAWKGALEDKDIWAISHYVHSLMAMRDTKDAALMRERFAAQGRFEVPKAEEPKPAEPPPPAEPAKDDKKGDDKKDDKKGK